MSERKLAKLLGSVGWAGVGPVAALLILLPTACSGGGESAGDGVGGGTPTLATLEVITDAVTGRLGDSTDFGPVESGSTLAQGDEIRTDATGFAEVVFFDGSWQRVDSQTTLTLTELVDIEGGRVVRTGIDQGRAWQRVEALTTEEESVELDTPVAVAAVRGTAYAAECVPEPVACTFSVLEGTVQLTLSGGSTIPLTAGQRLVAARDAPVGAPEDVGVAALEQQEWIARNLARDASAPPSPPAGDTDGEGVAPLDEEFAATANAICLTAGEQNRLAEADAGGADDLARQQADVLDRALDELDALEPPPGAAPAYDEMIDQYRRRTELVREALAATSDERPALVNELLVATADGAARARELGLGECVIRSG